MLKEKILRNSFDHADLEILQLIGKGKSNEEIAAATKFAKQTVKNRISIMIKSLEVKNRYQAHLVAKSRGWI